MAILVLGLNLGHFFDAKHQENPSILGPFLGSKKVRLRSIADSTVSVGGRPGRAAGPVRPFEIFYTLLSEPLRGKDHSF